VFTFKKPEPKVKKQPPVSKQSKKEELITAYANSSYRGEESPSTLKGRGGVTSDTGMSQQMFLKITAAAKRLNLIRTDKTMSYPNVSRSKFIVMILNEQPFVSGSFDAV
jgi:hypothetical protein